MRRLLAAIVLCALLTAGEGVAAATNAANRARLDATVRYLQEAQNRDGGFGGASGAESGQGFSAWVALALAAAGINPQDQAKPGGRDVFAFLVDHFQAGLEEEPSFPRAPTTAYERELMVVNAAGADPHRFAGLDLVAEILARARPDGAFPYVADGRGEVNATVFAILALAPSEEPAPRAAVQRAADWLAGAQEEDGSWSFEAGSGRGEVDMTGAAIQALRAAGRGGAVVDDGVDYLRTAQSPDGGFPEFPGEAESNVASTAWAAQAIWSIGEDPETWLGASGADPLSFMASLQQSDGHIRWKRSEDLNGLWMTAYVAPAFAGVPWPIPAVPRAASQPAVPPQLGQGGGTQSSRGVIAGGGGRGAPLFSRPKAQSKGDDPGGRRALRRVPESEHEAQIVTPARGSPRRGSGHEVSGVLVGGGVTGPVAPGLHGAGTTKDGAPWMAVGIGVAALLAASCGSQLERRRGRAFA
jgi:Squalene-hopene cyclase C-terminal domain/Prenyltransferase and squalene oxidase repeat